MAETSIDTRAGGVYRDLLDAPLDRKRPLSGQVYEHLRRLIITLELKPGETLSKVALAEAMEISQTPVREAILRLEEEALVDVYPQSKTAVTLLDLHQARELQLMRVAIECELAKGIAIAVDTSIIDELAATIEAQATALADHDFEAFAKADAVFHAAQYRFCDVAGLWDLVMRRRGHMDRFRRLHVPLRDKERQVLAEHRTIFETIRSKDPDAASAAVRHHLSRTFEVGDQIVKAYPHYFMPGTEQCIDRLRFAPQDLKGAF